MANIDLKIEGLKKHFGGVRAVDGISVHVQGNGKPEECQDCRSYVEECDVAHVLSLLDVLSGHDDDPVLTVFAGIRRTERPARMFQRARSFFFPGTRDLEDRQYL